MFCTTFTAFYNIVECIFGGLSSSVDIFVVIKKILLQFIVTNISLHELLCRLQKEIYQTDRMISLSVSVISITGLWY